MDCLEMTKLRSNFSNDNQIKPHEGPAKDTIFRSLEARCSENPIKVFGIFVGCFMGFFVMFSVLKNPSSSEARLLDSRPFGKGDAVVDIPKQNIVKRDNFPEPVEKPQDKLLGGLLPAGLDEKSCLSRYQSVLYRKQQSGRPSSHLISRLRGYEALHKRCGPFTDSYNRTLEYLKSSSHGEDTNSTGCKYIVWIQPIQGLGNRILSLASAFLYALLTDRVLLVDPGGYIPDLFCEPFPGVSWLLPSDFPIAEKFNSFDKKSPESYGNLLKTNVLHNSTLYSLPPFIYLHLLHDYDKGDMLFFCDQDQAILKEVPWMILKSNNYFIPSLFLIPSFEQELNDLFPEKGAVFHYLGQYLFHPTNSVWGLITRYYNTYLAKADEKIGIQIRVLETETGPFKYVLDQVLACVMKENLLPQVNEKEDLMVPYGRPNKTRAVLMTSLNSGYFEAIRDMYWEHPTITGEVIEVYQPSNEEYQHTENQMHNMKAWAEIYLLSLTDKLVTSAWSTFGYVAQSLGGLKPWILYMPENRTAPDPPCQHALSMEPCFHAPPTYDCKEKGGIDTSKLSPHVQHCEDRSWGLKLVDGDNRL
ncbi:unnamed protein product [Coffea canephora]|uniref:Fucosyltransferase n=1 Tax=Coffea canephora TaxID=49390 RepID=A0A068VF66_COFCA|nr:unnamed protein product [Coffea canephora]